MGIWVEPFRYYTSLTVSSEEVALSRGDNSLLRELLVDLLPSRAGVQASEQVISAKSMAIRRIYWLRRSLAASYFQGKNNNKIHCQLGLRGSMLRQK